MLRFLTVLTHLSFVYCWTQSTLPISYQVQSKFSRRRQQRFGMASSGEPTSPVETGSVKVLGVCGGIGSGKSTACQMLVSELKCLAHIDSDSIAHTVYDPNSIAMKEIVDEFGSDLLLNSGEIDRKKLGAIVFADINAMKKLESIVWPHVKTKIIQQIDALKSEISFMENDGIPVIVVEAAVLLDAEWTDFLDGIWVVTASNPVAIRRLQENRNLSVDEATKRIQAQSSRRGIGNLQNEVNDGTVTAVIHNDRTVDDLKTYLEEKLHDPNAWYRQR